MTSILRADPKKVRVQRKALNFLYWALIGLNVITSAWSLKQNAAFSQTGIPNLLTSAPLPVVDWVIPILAASCATAISAGIVQLFVTNPTGIPTVIEEIIGNVKGGKPQQLFVSLITTVLFIVIMYVCYRSYIFDINTTAAGLGFPTLQNGLMSHSLNFIVFAIVGGSEIISVVLNAGNVLDSLPAGGAKSGSRNSMPASRGNVSLPDQGDRDF